MSHISVINNTSIPIHSALSWDGNLRFVYNSLQPGARNEWSEAGLFYDLTIVPGGKGNEFPENDLNSVNFGKLALQALDLAALNPIGLVMVLAPDGTYALNVKTGGGSPDLVIAGPSIQLRAVQIPGLYGPDGYTVTVTGGRVSVEKQSDGTFHVTGCTPLQANWENHTSHKHGTN